MFVYNQRPDRQLVFPLLDRISTDPYTQGAMSAGLLLILGLVAFVFAAIGVWRERAE